MYVFNNKNATLVTNYKVMIRAIIVDDEPKSIQGLLWELGGFKEEITIIESFTNPKEALSFLKTNTIDAVFLDIEMPIMDGFSFLDAVGEINFSVIITTAYNQYALKAIQKEAHDYLLKPVTETRLKEAIEKIKKRKQKSNTSEKFEQMLVHFNEKLSKKRIAINTDGCLLFIEPDKVMYAEAEGSYTTLFIENEKEIVVSKKMKDVAEMLNGSNFFRIHNSYIVNLYKIKKFLKTDSYVVMENGKKIPVSRSKKNDFLNQL